LADVLTHLVKRLARLPGVGERTATRFAFHILREPQEYAEQLAAAILQVKSQLRPCSSCHNLTEHDPCRICSDARRDTDTILVVATPQELMAIERGGSYRGKYHVLHGLISPLDGIGPDALRIRPLLARLSTMTTREVILATSPNVEGDATALYLASLIKPLGVKVSRIAAGVPIGGELEYADGMMLHRAIESRHEI
jgi:recombination protein RecR